MSANQEMKNDNLIFHQNDQNQETNRIQVISNNSQEPTALHGSIEQDDECEKSPTEKTDEEIESFMTVERNKINCPINNESVLNLLEMVKDFVNQSFMSQGVIAQLIKQDGENPFVNVSKHVILNIKIATRSAVARVYEHCFEK